LLTRNVTCCKLFTTSTTSLPIPATGSPACPAGLFTWRLIMPEVELTMDQLKEAYEELSKKADDIQEQEKALREKVAQMTMDLLELAQMKRADEQENRVVNFKLRELDALKEQLEVVHSVKNVRLQSTKVESDYVEFDNMIEALKYAKTEQKLGREFTLSVSFN